MFAVLSRCCRCCARRAHARKNTGPRAVDDPARPRPWSDRPRAACGTLNPSVQGGGGVRGPVMAALFDESKAAAALSDVCVDALAARRFLARRTLVHRDHSRLREIRVCTRLYKCFLVQQLNTQHEEEEAFLCLVDTNHRPAPPGASAPQEPLPTALICRGDARLAHQVSGKGHDTAYTALGATSRKQDCFCAGVRFSAPPLLSAPVPGVGSLVITARKVRSRDWDAIAGAGGRGWGDFAG